MDDRENTVDDLDKFIADECQRDPEFARHWAKETRRIRRRDRLVNLWRRLTTG